MDQDHPHVPLLWAGRLRIGFVAVLSLVLMAASCDPIEEDPDAEQFTAVLEDCVVEDVDASSGVETCTISSADQRVNGSWEFSFAVERDDDRRIYRGSISISTSSGVWQGDGERVVLDSGGWKGYGGADGLGGYESFTMGFEAQEESFEGLYPLTGEIAPND